MNTASMFSRGYVREEITQHREEDHITLDAQQEKAVLTEDPCVLVVAGAGSGKTRVLTERIKHLLDKGVPPCNIVAITFTNMAAEEMKERLYDVEGIGDAFIGTIHSFANKVMKLSGEKYQIYNDQIDNDYHRELITKYCRSITFDRFLEFKDVQTQAMMGKISEKDAEDFLLPSEAGELRLIERKKGEIEYEIQECGSTDYPESIDTLCKKRGVITFDELLKKAEAYFRSINAEIEHVLVDEFQDVGTLEFNFIDSLQAKNYFLVGDDWQCQPEGTIITMEDGTHRYIENIKAGDRVLSYNLHEGRYYSRTLRGFGKRVLEVQKHSGPKDLITITTEGCYESSYTLNHKCLARIHYEGNEKKSVVYIMENSKGQFRVGSTKLFTMCDRNFGVRGRMNTEGGVRAWILDVFDNPKDAWVCEQICAYEFGIPQMTWTFRETRFTEEDADHVYSHLPNLRYAVSSCLERYGRDINYPIFVKDENKHFSKLHLTEVHACNLIPLVMDIAIPVKAPDTNRWSHVYQQITHRYVIGSSKPVYALKIEDTGTYVADNILTHNSIYSFKGGNVKIFMKLIEDGQFTVFYLTNNYRNSKAVLDISNTIINQVSHKIDKSVVPINPSEGSVQIVSKRAIGTVLHNISCDGNYRDYFILVRSNKDLFKMVEMCQEYEIPVTTFKREGMTLADLRKKMEENRVKVLTVHVSKGLEVQNVILYGNFPIVCPQYRLDEEERKVMYVGITRAKENLIIMN